MDKDRILSLLSIRINSVNSYWWGDPDYINGYWDELANNFSEAEEKEVFNFLYSLDDEQLTFISEITDDLLEIFSGSKTFERRYRNLGIDREIDLNINYGGIPTSGFHTESSLKRLEEAGFPARINKILPNGVRVGEIPCHKDVVKRCHNGQAWFPEDWTDDDVLTAATYVINQPENHMSKYLYIGKYEIHGEEVRLIMYNNDNGLMYPDKDNQPSGWYYKR